MGIFANLTAKLGIDTSQFNKGLRAASATVTRFSKQVAKDFRATSKSAAKASDSFKILRSAADKGYKSVRRITQGIIVSQAFYRTVHAIQDAVEVLYDFSQAVEENRVAFTGLIGDADKARRLNETLQDLAADTPYAYEHAVDNARMLLAYEFPLQNIERIMRSIADATAASGKIESYKNISAALGQIQAKGRLTARELIRFATAGIPVYQILREELGMTHEQIVNIGNLRIPADVAIPAILRGIEKRYAGAAAAMQRTTKGLTNAIKENFLIISQNVFDPLYQNLRVNMEELSNKLEAMKEDVRKGGFGYMLANMFPPEIVQRIQLFAANIQMLIQNIAAMYKALAPVGRAFTELFINTFNAIMPFINMFTRVLAVLMQMLTSNSTAVRIFVSALGGLFIINAVIKLILGFSATLKSLLIVKLVAQGIIYLGKAIGYLTMMLATNPLAAFVGLAIGGLLAMTLASKKFGSAVDSLMGKISGAFGVDPSKIFVPKMEENTKIADEFNQELELSSEGLEKMGNKAKEAGKKAKQALMAFDEVFVLPDPDIGAGAESLDDIFDISDIETPAIPPFDASEMFPDVGAAITEWTQGVANSIRDKLVKAIAGAGIGAAIGAVLGGIFGGLPGAILGAKIGAVAGAIAGLFWDKLVEFFKTPTGKGVGIGATLGAIIGGIIGGPIGAVVGAILGGVAGGIAGHFWDDLKKAFENSTVRGATLGAALGALIGLAIAGPLGAGIGAVIGGGLGAVVGHFWEDLKKAFESDAGRGATIGASIGALIGLIVGGPMGAALGAGLGGVIGGLLPSFWEHVTEWYKETKAKFEGWWKDTKDGFVSWKDETVASIVEWKENTVTNIGNWYDETKTKLSDWWSETKTGFINWYDETKTKLSDWWSETKTGFINWYDETKIKLSDWWSETKTKLSDWWSETKTGFSDWYDETKTKLSDWWSETKTGFINWYDETKIKLSDWWSEIKTGFSNWYDETKTKLSDWYDETKTKLSDWWSETKTGFINWYDETKIKLNNWWSETKTGFINWYDETKIKLSDWWNETKTGFINWYDETKIKLSDWWSEIKTGFNNWYNETKIKLNNWWSETKTGFGNWWSETKTKLNNWWSETKTGFSDWYDETKTKLSDWWSETKTEFGNWYDETKTKLSDWWSETKTGFSNWYDETKIKLSDWWSEIKTGFSNWYDETKTKLSDWWSETKTGFSNWYDETKTKLSDWCEETYIGFSNWWEDSKTGFLTWAEDVYNSVVEWFDKLRKKLKSFFDDLKSWKKEANDEASSIASASSSGGTVGSYSMDPVTIGHAKGGIFNKEHIARLNEGNKIEAILPVENPSAMAKVRQAIFGGEPIEMFNRLINDIISTQPSPIIYEGNQQPTPVYVGTLIADERGLRELERRLYDIRIAERYRRGE